MILGFVKTAIRSVSSQNINKVQQSMQTHKITVVTDYMPFVVNYTNKQIISHQVYKKKLVLRCTKKYSILHKKVSTD